MGWLKYRASIRKQTSLVTVVSVAMKVGVMYICIYIY